MLINWQDEQRIVVTENQDDESPRKFDDAGDFWVGSATPQPPEITLQPQDQTVSVGQTAQFQIQATGSGPLSYQWQRDAGDIGGANAPSYSFIVGVNDDGAGFRCLVSNPQGSVTSDTATLTVLGDTTPPVIEGVSAPGSPDSVWVTFSEPVEQGSSEDASNYSLDKGIDVFHASRQEDQSIVLLTVSDLSGGETYTLAINNVRDQAAQPNTIAPDSTFQFTYVDQNQPPTVDAGPDASVRQGDDLLLSGVANDDGLPAGTISFSWEMVSGPGQVSFSSPHESSTYANFDSLGDYVLGLTADDGDKTGFDEVVVTVLPRPSMTIVSPAGGESWKAGNTESIDWIATGVSNVSIDFSTDGGLNWRAISQSVDEHNDPDQWGHYPWTVPNDPTDQALIQLTVYSDPANAVRSNPFSIIGSGQQSITLLSPAGGETLTGNSVFHLTWEAENIDVVVIEFSYDAGVTWSSVAMVDSTQTQWLDYSWNVPNVATPLAQMRLRSPGGSVQDTSGFFTIEPEAVTGEDVGVNSVTIHGYLPPEAQRVDKVRVGGRDFPVEDGRFDAMLDIPSGAERFTFIMEAESGNERFSRTVDLKFTQTIGGLGVSAKELREFVGDRGGILVWVNAGGQLQVLDFRARDPQVQTMKNTTDCVNPLISPDGTRIVYSQGRPNGPKSIFVMNLSDGRSNMIATGDIGYWHFSDSGQESIIYCDWSDKNENGADGKTYSIKLNKGDITASSDATVILDRAMDAGANLDLSWVGQVYGNLWAHDLVTGADYPMEKFFLMSGEVADHQTCNGSMAPDSQSRLMCLVIPHDFIRIFTYDKQSDTFRQSSEFRLPQAMTEWEFPEWSTDPGYFTAILRASDLQNRLFIGKIAQGALVPDVLEVSGERKGATYSHLWLAP